MDYFEDIIEEQDLFEHHKWVVDKGQNPLRIDKFIFDRLAHISRNKIQNAASANSILVNNKPEKSNYKVKPNDVITIVLPFPPKEFELIPQDIPLDIIYEDDSLLIVNKQAGIVVHPGYGNYDGTLVNGLLYHFQNLPNCADTTIRPGLVHRIDKNTTGLMVIAKTEYALTHLAKQFFDRTIDRTYIALVWGEINDKKGTIIGNVGRNLKNRKVMDVFEDDTYGKHAVTHYKVIENLGYVTLVECKLETGRTHQIRVHFKHIEHPLFNDEEYGGNRIVKGTTFTKYKQFVQNCFNLLPRQALHAKSLGFIHPATKEKMFFDSILPADMEQVIEKWKGYKYAS